MTFPLSRLGRRGYDETPVHEFLDEVHAEFMRLINERASLWQEVERLRRRIIAGNMEGDSKGVLFGEADAHVHAVRILSTAQVTADRYVADAQAYSSRVTEEARLRRDDIIRQAQQHSDMLLEEAHTRAREAAVSALDVATPPQTDRERRAAQAELAYLRTYTDVYRSHLRAYTEGVLRGIEEWERKEASAHDAAHSQDAASVREAALLPEGALGPAERRSIGHSGSHNGSNNGDGRRRS